MCLQSIDIGRGIHLFNDGLDQPGIIYRIRLKEYPS